MLKRPRGRRVTVPGEVMPPYDPDSPIASTEVSDWESPAPSPPRPVLKFKPPKPPVVVASTPKEKPTPAAEKPRAAREPTEQYHKPTPPPEDAPNGSKYRPWTHLTEYEMFRLRKKMKKNHVWEPSDVMIRRELADLGRGWENYYRAKAEAQTNGTPFIDIDSVEKSKNKVEKVERNGKVDKAATVEVLSKPQSTVTTEMVDHTAHEAEREEKLESPSLLSVTATPSATPAPKPKVARKTDPKKEKKPDPARSQAALAAQEAELAARRLGDIGSKFRTLFTTPFASALASLRSTSSPTVAQTYTAGKKSAERTSKKRKAEGSPASSASPSAEPDPARKKPRTAPKPSPLAGSPVSVPPSIAASASSEPPATTPATIKIPLKLTVSTSAAAAPSKTPTPAPPTRAASVQRNNSVAPRTEPTPPVTSRPPSRRSAAASVEPAPARSSQRLSMTPSLTAGQRTPVTVTVPALLPEPSPKSSTAASRRSKRDAPGTVMQSSQDGGAAVSVSKRKTKPAKQPHKWTPKSTAASPAAAVAAETGSTTMPQIRIDVDGRQELVDPDEERYCVCGDVSWGEMICCELDEKCDFGQWFHMECVSLAELPPRTVKWYCPGDRKKYHRGENSNGLVGRGIK